MVVIQTNCGDPKNAGICLVKRVLTIAEFKEGHSRDFVFDLPEPFTPWLNTFRPFHDICCFRLIQLVFNEMNESALILALKFAPRLTRYLGGVWSETAETWNFAQTHPLGHPARWKQFPYHYYSKSLNYSMLSQIVFFSLFCSSSQSSNSENIDPNSTKIKIWLVLG